MYMQSRLTTLLIMVFWLIIAIAAYWPGLHGGFLFDDFANLPALGSQGPIDHWPSFWRYITAGKADPIGRPLTMLTFLLDATDWPAAPYSFKLTNLVLHLINGVLLYWLLRRLGLLLGYQQQRASTAAWFGSALWLLHPLLVSTTLYIVQREAMLPATCVMTGLLLWLHGRTALLNQRRTTGLLYCAAGLGGFTVLGMLAKANGALLPIFALLMETILLAPRHPIPAWRGRRAYRLILLCFGTIPSVLLIGYLAWTALHGIISGGPVGIRPWSIGQRLLTEPRVLMDYLQLLWLPRPFSSGLFNDQYTVSTSLFSPLSTLPAMFALLAVISMAWHWRRRHPAFALAILFYFAGQLIESTSIPLELYFEHRNYLPALLMFWPLGLVLAERSTMPLVKGMLLVGLPISLATLTYLRAELWGDSSSQAMLWAKLNPDSPRAQASAAEIEMQRGQPRRAVGRLQRLLKAQPDQAQLAFNLIDARCMSGGLRPGDWEETKVAMHGTPNTGPLFAQWFERVLPIALSGRCPGLELSQLQQLIDVGLRNPHLGETGPKQDLLYLQGRLALAQHRPDLAQNDFVEALDLQVHPGMALKAAATLGAAGYPAQGLSLLNHYERVKSREASPGLGMPMLHSWILKEQGYWPGEVKRLRQQLTLDAQERNTNTSGTTPPDTSR